MEVKSYCKRSTGTWALFVLATHHWCSTFGMSSLFCSIMWGNVSSCKTYWLVYSQPDNDSFPLYKIYFKNLKQKNKLKAIVTAGPTKEYIDPVRYISNKSSGKQGYEIAKSLSKKGFETTLISGPTNLDINNDINLIKVETEYIHELWIRG